MSTGARTTRDLALLAALRLSLSAVVWSAGFRAVSDDDFARVVHAQEWAHAPALDPTGTSWLPFPFWLNGAVMLLGGTDLDVARVTAWILGVASTWLLYAAARLLLDRRRDALLGAAIATVLPWSVRLGVATVPELPTAALTVFAIATIASRRHLVLGGLALLAATLSRYEPWPVAAAFAALCAWEAVRHGYARQSRGREPTGSPARAASQSAQGEATPPRAASQSAQGEATPPRAASAARGEAGTPSRRRSQPAAHDETAARARRAPSPAARAERAEARRRGEVVVATLFAAAGPLAWIAHNARAHGDPMHFVARVSAYKQAVGGSIDALAYPLSLFREEPELAIVAAALGLATLLRRTPARATDPSEIRAPGATEPAEPAPTEIRAPAEPAWRRTLPRAAALLALLLATLSLAALRGGAPTHHAGRAVLAIWLAAALFVAPAIRAAFASPRRQAFALLVVTTMPLGAFILRPWYARLDDFTPRHEEVAIGRAAAALAAPTDPILVIAPDYRHFAIQAATARPWTVRLADATSALDGGASAPVIVAPRRHVSPRRPPAITTPRWAAWVGRTPRTNGSSDGSHW